MSRIQTLFKREFRGYFATPVAYVFIVIFLFLTGIFTSTSAASTNAARRTWNPSSGTTHGCTCC